MKGISASLSQLMITYTFASFIEGILLKGIDLNLKARVSKGKLMIFMNDLKYSQSNILIIVFFKFWFMQQ